MNPLDECHKPLTRDSLLSGTFNYFGNDTHIYHVTLTSNCGGIRFEKNSIFNYKIYRIFSGMGNINFYITVIIFGKSGYLEIVGRNYAAVGNDSLYSHFLVE